MTFGFYNPFEGPAGITNYTFVGNIAERRGFLASMLLDGLPVIMYRFDSKLLLGVFDGRLLACLMTLLVLYPDLFKVIISFILS
jgi:hypothetical protein